MKAYEIFQRYADEAGWNTDSKIRVLTDFINELELLDNTAKENIQETLDNYLQARVQEEQKYGHLINPVAEPKHNHFGEMFCPNTCSACALIATQE